MFFLCISDNGVVLSLRSRRIKGREWKLYAGPKRDESAKRDRWDTTEGFEIPTIALRARIQLPPHPSFPLCTPATQANLYVDFYTNRHKIVIPER